MIEIKGKSFDEERALYNLTDATVTECTFAGAADGESAFKESRNVTARHCTFSLRYPFWHSDNFSIENCSLDANTRAPLWYSTNGTISDSRINGVKCLRECADVRIVDSKISSAEFGWRCRGIKICDSSVESEYFMLESRDVKLRNVVFKGKYSFQYNENLTIEDSVLDTKDAFWHAKNTVVKNCNIKGEYLGWYSDGLTLINCHISGTQPLCYCKNLRLIGCTMENTDLAFEYSEVEADICGNVISVKNPLSGKITADGFGTIISDGSIYESSCDIIIR